MYVCMWGILGFIGDFEVRSSDTFLGEGKIKILSTEKRQIWRKSPCWAVQCGGSSRWERLVWKNPPGLCMTGTRGSGGGRGGRTHLMLALAD